MGVIVDVVCFDFLSIVFVVDDFVEDFFVEILDGEVSFCVLVVWVLFKV